MRIKEYHSGFCSVFKLSKLPRRWFDVKKKWILLSQETCQNAWNCQEDDFTRRNRFFFILRNCSKCLGLPRRWFHAKKRIFYREKLLKMRGVTKKMISRKKWIFFIPRNCSKCVGYQQDDFTLKMDLLYSKKLVRMLGIANKTISRKKWS